MCGITQDGRIAALQRPSRRPERNEPRLRHRGPDGEGSSCDGRRRPGNAAPGHHRRRRRQPAHVRRGRLGRAFVLNGEIYNFQGSPRSSSAGTFKTSSATPRSSSTPTSSGAPAASSVSRACSRSPSGTRRARLARPRDRLGKQPLVYHLSADGGLASHPSCKRCSSTPACRGGPSNGDRRLPHVPVRPVPIRRCSATCVKLPPASPDLTRTGHTVEPVLAVVRFGPKVATPRTTPSSSSSARLRGAVRRA